MRSGAIKSGSTQLSAEAQDRNPRTHLPERLEIPKVAGALATMALAIGAGAAIAARPDAWVLIAAPATVIALWISPTTRLSFVVLVGVIVLGPPELTSAKLLYFGGLFVGFLAAVQSLFRHSDSLPRDVLRLIRLSALGAILLGLVAVFRLTSGTDPASVLRDFAPYLLLAVAPLLAIDAAVSLSLDRLQVVAVIGLTAGSAAFLVSWTVRRGIVIDPSGTTAFGGFFMPIALLILSAVCLMDGRLLGRPSWSALAGLAAATAIVTGTRSFVLEIPAVVVAIAITGSKVSSRVRRVVLGLAVVGASGALLALLAISLAGIDAQSIIGRWSMLISAIGDPMGDASLAGWAAQTAEAWRLFLSSPIFGVPTGLGSAFVGDYASDTPLALFAGLGLVGVAAVLAMLLGWIGLVLRRPFGAKWLRAAMIGMLVAGVTFASILPIVQDKGLGFAFLLVGAPLLRTLMGSNPADRGPVVVQRSSGSRHNRLVPQSLDTRSRSAVHLSASSPARVLVAGRSGLSERRLVAHA